MSHVEKDEKRGGGGCTEVDRKKIPCVSPGMGEMKCELTEWKGIRERWRMKIMGNEHRTAIDSERETDWTRVRHHPVPAPLAKQRP